MHKEMKSMKENAIWDLIELPRGVKPISCKRIFKTKEDSKCNIERYKTHLITNNYTQKEDINIKRLFCRF